MRLDQTPVVGKPDNQSAVDANAAPCDMTAREITLSRWQQLQRSGLTVHSLQTFYARHKYLVMSRDIESYRRIGKMLATVTATELPVVAQQTIEVIMEALQKAPTRGGHTNVLQHIRGYLKRVLNADEKAALTESIERYHSGDIPLSVPLELLQQYFREHPDAYIEQQVFMQIYLDTQYSRDHI